MKLNKIPTVVTIMIVSLVVLALSGCTSPTPTPAPAVTPTPEPTVTPVPAATVLVINGSVATPLSLSLADLQTYPQMTVNETTTDSAGVVTVVNGTGPLLNALIDAAVPLSNATNVTFYSQDYMETIARSVVTESPNATVIILSDGSLRDVIPGQNASAWVSNLTAIEVS